MKTEPNDLIHSFPDGPDSDSNWEGLTKREYFAASSIQGILSWSAGADIRWEEVAESAVFAADALIIALNKGKTNDTEPKLKPVA